MNRKSVIVKEIRVTVITAIVVIISFAKIVSAESLYGCPKDEIVMRLPGICPDGSNAAVLKEGCLYDGDRAILDTLSVSEKQKLGIKKDNRFVMVVYASPVTGEASLVPGKDKSGNVLTRKVVDLRYGCVNGSIIAAGQLFPDCQPLTDFGKSAADLANEKKVLNLKAKNAEPQLRESLRRSIEESWPIYNNQLKQAGLSDNKIKELWEEQKKLIYEQYNYDPKTDKFIFDKTNH